VHTLITFLGKKPIKTSYAWQGQVYEGEVFAEALRQFVAFDHMLVFSTPEAHQYAWPALEKLHDPRIEEVPIPIGQNNQEIWQIFEQVIERVPRCETVAFDITHGLRSIPFLVFLFAAYLKTARQVTIDAIYYGAFELGSAEQHLPAPVIDLSEFTSMLDWLTATNRFVETGDGDAMARLLRAGMPAGVQMSNDPQARQLGQQLKSAADAIEAVSLALSTARPVESMQSAAHLAATLQQASPGIRQRARPFDLLADQVVAQYGQFGLEDPMDEAQRVKNLRRQLAMIGWYLDRRRIIQAVTLAREWIVSLLAYTFGADMFDSRSVRPGVETALNNGVERRKPARPLRNKIQYDEQFEALPQANELAGLWSQLIELRNDLAHVGMRQSPKPARKLYQKARTLQPALENLAQAMLPGA